MKSFKSSLYLYGIVLIIYMLGLSFPVYSQSVWQRDPGDSTTVGLDLAIPSFHYVETNDSPELSFFLYSYVPLRKNLSLRLNLPVSRYSNGGGEGTISVGNPYVGFRFGEAQASTHVDVGIRLPFASGDNGGIITGLLSQNYQVGAYIPRSLSLVSNIYYSYHSTSGVIFKAGGGPELLIPTEGAADPELFVKYYGQILYQIDKVIFGGGFTGQLLATERNLSFSERTVHYGGLTASYKFNRITAGAYIRHPFDKDVNEFVRYVVGLNLAFHF